LSSPVPPLPESRPASREPLSPVLPSPMGPASPVPLSRTPPPSGVGTQAWPPSGASKHWLPGGHLPPPATRQPSMQTFRVPSQIREAPQSLSTLQPQLRSGLAGMPGPVEAPRHRGPWLFPAQSPLVLHCTQIPADVSQCGAAGFPLQSVSLVHWTHVSNVLQTLLGVEVHPPSAQSFEHCPLLHA